MLWYLFLPHPDLKYFGFIGEVWFLSQTLRLYSQPNFNPIRSWCEHIIEWNPPSHQSPENDQIFLTSKMFKFGSSYF